MGRGWSVWSAEANAVGVEPAQDSSMLCRFVMHLTNKVRLNITLCEDNVQARHDVKCSSSYVVECSECTNIEV